MFSYLKFQKRSSLSPYRSDFSRKLKDYYPPKAKPNRLNDRFPFKYTSQQSQSVSANHSTKKKIPYKGFVQRYRELVSQSHSRANSQRHELFDTIKKEKVHYSVDRPRKGKGKNRVSKTKDELSTLHRIDHETKNKKRQKRCVSDQQSAIIELGSKNRSKAVKGNKKTKRAVKNNVSGLTIVNPEELGCNPVTMHEEEKPFLSRIQTPKFSERFAIAENLTQKKLGLAFQLQKLSALFCENVNFIELEVHSRLKKPIDDLQLCIQMSEKILEQKWNLIQVECSKIRGQRDVKDVEKDLDKYFMQKERLFEIKSNLFQAIELIRK